MSRKRLMFLCTGNSCRSQMAEGWARHFADSRLEVYSAGVAPHGLDPRAVQVMREVEIDISGHSSDHVDSFGELTFDVVVTVCDRARGECPVYTKRTDLRHHGFDDPPALARETNDERQILAAYRRVRDEIRDYVRQLVAEMLQTDLYPDARVDADAPGE